MSYTIHNSGNCNARGSPDVNEQIIVHIGQVKQKENTHQKFINIAQQKESR